MHGDDLTVGKPQRHLGATGQSVGPGVAQRPGLEPPVQFVDPVREDGQLVGALDRLGGVPWSPTMPRSFFTSISRRSWRCRSLASSAAR
ncbi:hypothetical protein BZL30_3767 [Mycobacterium kansasii]|uniref:Uncharacterized protein n=1 Tax=Mycobacterium kansasii TaxID=1768 RepID=A0A1V3XA52_MYCKA|nr:hypothetical protein BZL30_3767 [Mycobacterium kansasii]